MHISDHRLARVLSESRLERAESLRSKNQRQHQKGTKQRLGLLLIAQGERLANSEARAA